MNTMESTADALARDAGFFFQSSSGSLTTRLRPLYFHMYVWLMPFPSRQKGYSLSGKNSAELFFKDTDLNNLKYKYFPLLGFV